MAPFLLAIAAAGLIPAAPARALQTADEPAPPGGVSVRGNFNGAELADSCRSDDNDRYQTSRNLLCAGYIIGVLDSFNFIQDVSGSPGRFCPGESRMRGDYVEAFEQYFAQNPDMADMPAVWVILRAFEWRFPCPQGAAD